MKLYVYKGFDIDFLSKISEKPLMNNSIEEKIDVLSFTNKTKKLLKTTLLSMDEDDEYWITYEEYSLIIQFIELSIKEEDLQVQILMNNLYPDYYPLNLKIEDMLIQEIQFILENESHSEPSAECSKFLQIYSDLVNINDILYISYYNHELNFNKNVEIKKFYPDTKESLPLSTSDLHIHIPNDIPLYIKDLQKIESKKINALSYSITKGAIADRNLASLRAYCDYNNIQLFKKIQNLEVSSELDKQLVDIAKNIIKIPNFKDFRKIKFYKNPDINNEVVEISQAQIISDIIHQAENSYSDDHNYKDIFITASTGAGKSVIFQIPAIYLAKKYHKLTIVIEPVKALMEDQKEQLINRGYNRVASFNSNLITQSEKEAVLKKVKDGYIDLLYLSPETLLSYSLDTLIGDREVGLLIIDEAHIVTTWGFGFRPDYWYLGGYINKLRNKIQTAYNKNQKIMYFPICSFTATAVNGGVDDSVSETIVSLFMENPIKYIGYVKRDNIKFDINIKSTEKTHQNIYERAKAGNLIERISDWIRTDKKTIVYFPYASLANDAYKGIKSFSGNKGHQLFEGLYTGRNVEGINEVELVDLKQKAFEDFRSGKRNIMLATKAFGMGIDIDNIENVYHYAVTGNLSDYVQEIGRAARNQTITGYAITDYYYNDVNYMKQLFGMSQIMQFQINKVLAEIYRTYINKGEKRNFLISPEAFTYIFEGKNKRKEDQTKNQINKLKTCLLMLEKDLHEKTNFKVLISRPQSIFTKAFVVLHYKHVNDVINSKYGKYFEFISKGRDHEPADRGTNTSDIGDIYKLDLKSLWEDCYPNISFPQFKYWYFNKDSNKPDKIDIMKEISDYYYIRQKVTVETKGEILLCELRKKILEDFDYIADVLYSSKFRKSFFTLDEFVAEISKKYGNSKAKIIANSIFQIADPLGRCIKQREYHEAGITEYAVSSGVFKAFLDKTITKSTMLQNLSDNTNTSFSSYMSLEPNSFDSKALKMLSLFDYISYEVQGGEEPEIFIRLNDPEKVRRIISNEIPYRNDYVTKAKQKHDREVAILHKFFTSKMTDEERWAFIEDYFLGHDLLHDIGYVEEKKVDLIKAINKEKSYQSPHDFTWDDMKILIEDQYIAKLETFAKLQLPIPEYVKTVVKNDLLNGYICMSWPSKNILMFSEPISNEDKSVCDHKGWYAFDIQTVTVQELSEVLL